MQQVEKWLEKWRHDHRLNVYRCLVYQILLRIWWVRKQRSFTKGNTQLSAAASFSAPPEPHPSKVVKKKWGNKWLCWEKARPSLKQTYKSGAWRGMRTMAGRARAAPGRPCKDTQCICNETAPKWLLTLRSPPSSYSSKFLLREPAEEGSLSIQSSAKTHGSTAVNVRGDQVSRTSVLIIALTLAAFTNHSFIHSNVLASLCLSVCFSLRRPKTC